MCVCSSFLREKSDLWFDCRRHPCNSVSDSNVSQLGRLHLAEILPAKVSKARASTIGIRNHKLEPPSRADVKLSARVSTNTRKCNRLFSIRYWPSTVVTRTHTHTHTHIYLLHAAHNNDNEMRVSNRDKHKGKRTHTNTHGDKLLLSAFMVFKFEQVARSNKCLHKIGLLRN